jgi:predicted AlkP superfamily pyrophosphatase or phosphodiesterase
MASMDAILHQYGKNHQQVSAKIAWYENQLNTLVSAAKEHYKEVRLFIFSDHGMTDVHTDFNLMQLIEETGLRFGKDYAAVYDSTMARFWFIKGESEAPIRAVLEKISQGRILSPETLKEWGVDFPGQRYGHLFFLMNPGVLIVPSHMGERTIAGMHGYSPEDKDSTASFSSNVELETYPKGLEDLYTLFKQEIDRCQTPKP